MKPENKEILCVKCGTYYMAAPASARFDGELTYVGYLPHNERDCLKAKNLNTGNDNGLKTCMMIKKQRVF